MNFNGYCNNVMAMCDGLTPNNLRKMADVLLKAAQFVEDRTK